MVIVVVIAMVVTLVVTVIVELKVTAVVIMQCNADAGGNGMSIDLPAGCWTHLSRKLLCGEG